jgi:hypothetical protein
MLAIRSKKNQFFARWVESSVMYESGLWQSLTKQNVVRHVWPKDSTFKFRYLIIAGSSLPQWHLDVWIWVNVKVLVLEKSTEPLASSLVLDWIWLWSRLVPGVRSEIVCKAIRLKENLSRLKGVHKVLELFAFGRLQSSLPKALESLFDPPSTPPDFIEIGYSKVSYDTFLD